MKERRRELDSAIKAVDEAKRLVSQRAAELAIRKKDLPKDIRKSIRIAQEATEDAALAHEASIAAFEHSYAALVAEVNANRATLEAAALTGAEQALERMALARKAFENATSEADATFGLLGMFFENDRQGRMLLKYRDPQGSKRPFYVGTALEEMGAAVGHTSLQLTAHRRGTAPTKRELDEATDGED
ncbi:MAG: hypothetical protein BGO97_03790 [Micrococcales bacterium 70-64]|nr:MAG: hypothetical protein BGO97_03790 [Micrococcales bacterium 70-64]